MDYTKFDERYLEMARVWAKNSYCRRRQVGALIVKDRMIISDGYNGTPSGFENVCEDENGVTKPYVLHAEANAIISAPRNEMLGATLYLCGKEADGSYVKNGSCCSMCKRMVINAGIKTVIIRDTIDEYRVIDVDSEWVLNDESLEGLFNY